MVRSRVTDRTFVVGKDVEVSAWDSPERWAVHLDVESWPERCAKCARWDGAHTPVCLLDLRGERRRLETGDFALVSVGDPQPPRAMQPPTEAPPPATKRQVVRRQVDIAMYRRDVRDPDGPDFPLLPFVKNVEECVLCAEGLVVKGVGGEAHVGPCEPLRACGHKDARLYRWFEDSKWFEGCRSCSALHDADEEV